MAVRKILIYPQHQTQLRKVRVPVPKFNKKANAIIHDLKDTLQTNSDGIGLDDLQINTHQRIIVVCLGNLFEEKCKAGPPTAMINPQIVDAKNERKDL